MGQPLPSDEFKILRIVNLDVHLNTLDDSYIVFFQIGLKHPNYMKGKKRISLSALKIWLVLKINLVII